MLYVFLVVVIIDLKKAGEHINVMRIIYSGIILWNTTNIRNMTVYAYVCLLLHVESAEGIKIEFGTLVRWYPTDMRAKPLAVLFNVYTWCGDYKSILLYVCSMQ